MPKPGMALGIFFLAGTLAATAASAQTSGPYTPEQAISVFYEALRTTLGFNGTPNGKQWLSMSMVGSLVAAGDVSQVNDLANFCPTTDPVILVYNRVRKLDRIYDRVNRALMGPLRPDTDEVKAANAVLHKQDGTASPDYAAYTDYESKYDAAFSKFLQSTVPADRTSMLLDINRIRRDWSVFGHRDEIDSALGVLSAAEMRMGGPMVQRRLDILKFYLDSGLAPSDSPGAFKSPTSEMSPTVDKWGDEAGWTGVKYSSQDTSMRYSSSTSNSRGFGGLNLGFVTVIGSGGGGNSSESRVSSVIKFAYAFELKRITIRRPWLDTEVFFEPAAWTWRKIGNTPRFPHVAVGPDAAGKPTEPSDAVYDNAAVDCPVLPLELVIARNRTLTATVSKSDYQLITTAGSSGGGGSLFGIFGGGGSRSWSTTNVRDDGTNVTFDVNAPGIAVIGMISETLPKLPEPNKLDQWPVGAWIE